MKSRFIKNILAYTAATVISFSFIPSARGCDESCQRDFASFAQPVQQAQSAGRSVRSNRPTLVAILNPGSSSGIVASAMPYVGMHERRNRPTLQGLIARSGSRINPASTPWCAAFANGILAKNNHRTANGNRAQDFARWGVAVRSPQEGDIVLIRGRGRISHVGFYAGTVNRNGRTFVRVLGGNQSNTVSIAEFSMGSVSGYRRHA